MYTIYRLWADYCEIIYETHRGQAAGIALHILQQSMTNVFIHYRREAWQMSLNQETLQPTESQLLLPQRLQA